MEYNNFQKASVEMLTFVSGGNIDKANIVHLCLSPMFFFFFFLFCPVLGAYPKNEYKPCSL